MKLLSNIVLVLLALSASTDAKPASPEVKPHDIGPYGEFGEPAFCGPGDQWAVGSFLTGLNLKVEESQDSPSGALAILGAIAGRRLDDDTGANSVRMQCATPLAALQTRPCEAAPAHIPRPVQVHVRRGGRVPVPRRLDVHGSGCRHGWIGVVLP